MVFATLQTQSLRETEIDDLDMHVLLLTIPVESIFTKTEEAFPFLSDKQVKELEDVGAGMVLSESKEEIESYYKQVPNLMEALPICVYYDKYNNVVMQK